MIDREELRLLALSAHSQAEAAAASLAELVVALEEPEPAITPLPSEDVVGDGWELQRDWTFGKTGNVSDVAALEREFQFHDQFGQVSCGAGKYGALTAATSDATAIAVTAFPVPPNHGARQPVDVASRTREFTDSSLLMHVRSLMPDGSVGRAWKHEAMCGSLVSKFTLPAGGADLARDLCWEVRFRQVSAPEGYWTAFWTCGGQWNAGPEYDLVECYSGTKDSGLRDANAWHSSAVGGTNKRFKGGESWWRGLGEAGFDLTTNEQSLRNIHTFTWLYRKDNTFAAYVDGKLVQEGTLIWRLGGKQTGAPTTMWFLHDFSFGHTDIWPINEVMLKPEQLPITGELFHSRVWLR